jgi:hypothetical protein
MSTRGLSGRRVTKVWTVLIAMVLLALPVPSALADIYTGQIWSPGDLPPIASVSGHNVGAPGQPTATPANGRNASAARPACCSAWPGRTASGRRVRCGYG